MQSTLLSAEYAPDCGVALRSLPLREELPLRGNLLCFSIEVAAVERRLNGPQAIVFALVRIVIPSVR